MNLESVQVSCQPGYIVQLKEIVFKWLILFKCLTFSLTFKVFKILGTSPFFKQKGDVFCLLISHPDHFMGVIIEIRTKVYVDVDNAFVHLWFHFVGIIPLTVIHGEHIPE